MDAQITYIGGGSDIIVPNPGWRLSVESASLTRGVHNTTSVLAVKIRVVCIRMWTRGVLLNQIEQGPPYLAERGSVQGPKPVHGTSNNT